MAGKAGRSGRKKSAPGPVTVAHQVRLVGDEAAAFAALLERRKAEASRVGARASAASLLRGIVRAALIAEGLLVEKTTKAAKR
jgi:hypothetical protein